MGQLVSVKHCQSITNRNYDVGTVTTDCKFQLNIVNISDRKSQYLSFYSKIKAQIPSNIKHDVGQQESQQKVQQFTHSAIW